MSNAELGIVSVSPLEQMRLHAEHCQQEIARLESRLRAAEALVREVEWCVRYVRLREHHNSTIHKDADAMLARLAAWLEGR